MIVKWTCEERGRGRSGGDTRWYGGPGKEASGKTEQTVEKSGAAGLQPYHYKDGQHGY